MNLSVMKYHIIPFGCQMNRSDTERIRTVLDSMGYIETPRDDENGTVIKGIVSCSVRQKAIDRVYGKIRKWNAAKTAAPLITFVSGCVLPADREKFLKLFDLVFPIEELHALPDMIRQYGVPTRHQHGDRHARTVLEEELGHAQLLGEQAWVQVHRSFSL